ncbi:MAG TPA: hypothetical protein VE869_16610 [Gemmatimonas sp.]|nr:hypothetical protein [Gemmatimonas sp.]
MTLNSQDHPSLASVSRRRGPRPHRRRGFSAAFGVAVTALSAAIAIPDVADARTGVLAPPRLEIDARAVDAASAKVELAASSRRSAFLDSLRGRSRKLRAHFVAPRRAAGIAILREMFGDSAVTKPGVYVASDTASGSSFNLITMRPFSDKVGGRIGSYRIGFFPEERRGARTSSYVNPEGFLEVTAANQATAVSEHFRLSDFLTHDQAGVWPKYLVLREPLIDKLELIIAELKGMGVNVRGMKVMSGFRTPQYNAQGVGAGGRAQDSRHQYGDAADVYVVNGSRDWMSDLNRDGRVDTRDAKVLAMAAERVESRNPDLVGGIGIYKATSAHGPFVHIDVRGNRARWGE